MLFKNSSIRFDETATTHCGAVRLQRRTPETSVATCCPNSSDVRMQTQAETAHQCFGFIHPQLRIVFLHPNWVNFCNISLSLFVNYASKPLRWYGQSMSHNFEIFEHLDQSHASLAGRPFPLLSQMTWYDRAALLELIKVSDFYPLLHCFSSS